MELNAEQIIQGLRNNDSPYVSDQNNIVDAISLIKQLTEENERLRAENAQIIKEAVFSPMERANNTLVVRADTVREMQERIKTRCIKSGIYPAIVARAIDQIAKEMTEGDDA